MEEIWKDIDGYDGAYQVSNLGRVKSFKCKEPRILKPWSAAGYLQVELWSNGIGKRFKVSRLVAFAFIPNPENKPEVNHVDRNKLNNCVENLEWATRLENQRHAIVTGLRKTNKRSRNVAFVLVRFLEQNGFKRVKGAKSGHRKMFNAATNRTTEVPMHTRDLGKGLEHKILKEAGLTK